MSGITFIATLFKAQTEQAGGWKIILDVPESDAKAILQLASLRDTPLSVGIVPYDPQLNEDIIDFSRELD